MIKSIRSTVIIFSLCLVLFLGSCTKQVRRQAYSTTVDRHAALNTRDQALVDKNCLWGVPQLSRYVNFGPTEMVYRTGYVIQHSSRDLIPVWVCEGFEEDQLNGPGDRDNSSFKPDPSLTNGTAYDSDYLNSGYDRGHMAPAGDFKKTQELMDESHYFSNIAPQVGVGFNRQIWKALEERGRAWLKDGTLGINKIYVITGGFFYDPEEDDPDTADGWIEYFVIGNNNVAVPTHFFKIIAAKHSDNEWKAVGFVLENKKHASGYDLADYIKEIDWIEEKTGINFMPELEDEDPDLEESLERQKGFMWN